MEQFQEYLFWKLFVIKTDYNPLTYIMTTPNLDTTWHCHIKSLSGITFSIKYQKEWDNAATDALRQVTSRMDVETVKSILDGVIVGSMGRVDAHDPVVAETDDVIHKKVQEAVIQARALHMHVNLHVTDWVLHFCGRDISQSSEPMSLWALSFGTLNGCLVHPTAPVLLIKSGQLGTSTSLLYGAWRNISVLNTLLLSYVNNCEKPSRKHKSSPLLRLRDRSNTTTERLMPYCWSRWPSPS